MSENNSIVNIDAKGLSKVGTALVEKVAEGIGGVFRPTQTVRMARAQAKADLISAKSQLEIDELQRRAMQRFVAEEAKKQSNIEAITQQAIPMLEDHSKPETIDDDWVSNFFDKSRIVSDEEMQGLWSRLLAGEANSPGKFSKRTVNLLADLDKSDAELFAKFCSFSWIFSGLKPLIFFDDNEVKPENKSLYKENGITFATMSHLASLGLINHGTIGGFVTHGLPKKFAVSYFKRPMVLEMPTEKMPVEIGNALFTNAGAQLAGICGSKPIPGFYDFVAAHFREKKFLVTEIDEQGSVRGI